MSKLEDKTMKLAALAASSEARDRALRGVPVNVPATLTPGVRRQVARTADANLNLKFDPDRTMVLDIVSRSLGMSPTAFAMQCIERTLDDLAELPEVQAAVAANGDVLADAVALRLGISGR